MSFTGTRRIVGGLLGYRPSGGTGGQTHDVPFTITDSGGKSSSSFVRVKVAAAPVDSDWPSGLTWASGAFLSAASDYTNFRNMRSRAIDIESLFLGSDYFGPRDLDGDGHKETDPTWDRFANNYVMRDGGRIETARAAGRIVAIAVPLCLKLPAEEQQFQALYTSAAQRDAHQNMANQVKAVYGTVTREPCYIRLGWEANKGYPWSLDDTSVANLAYYARCWSRIASIWKDTCPNVKMVWNHLRQSGTNIGNYYPGDAVRDCVDVLGLDPYDNSGNVEPRVVGTNFMKDAAGWDRAGYGGGAHNPDTGKVEGIEGFRQYALYLGKPLSFDEWGATNNGLIASSGANNSYYVQRMFQFMTTQAALGRFAFDSYFNNVDKHRLSPSNTWNANVRSGYIAAWTPT